MGICFSLGVDGLSGDLAVFVIRRSNDSTQYKVDYIYRSSSAYEVILARHSDGSLNISFGDAIYVDYTFIRLQRS